MMVWPFPQQFDATLTWTERIAEIVSAKMIDVESEERKINIGFDSDFEVDIAKICFCFASL